MKKKEKSIFKQLVFLEGQDFPLVRVCKGKESLQHNVFPGSHLTRYLHCPILLNFSVRKGTGVLNMVWQ